MVPPATTASPASPAAITPSMVRGPIDGRSKRRSWPGFGALTSTPVPAGERTRWLRRKFRHPLQHLVGALGGFHRDHMTVRDHHRLADIERPDRAQHFEAQADIGHIPFRWRDLPERAFRHQNFGRDLMRSQQTKAVIFQHPRHPGEQMIVATVEVTDGARKYRARSRDRN